MAQTWSPNSISLQLQYLFINANKLEEIKLLNRAAFVFNAQIRGQIRICRQTTNNKATKQMSFHLNFCYSNIARRRYSHLIDVINF